MSDITIDWLRALARDGGKGVVGNIDARCLGRIADDLDALNAELRIAGELHAEQFDKITEAAAFLDGLAGWLDGVPARGAAADCRAMAKRLRGET